MPVSHLPGHGLFDRVTFTYERLRASTSNEPEYEFVKRLTLPLEVRPDIVDIGGAGCEGYWFDQDAVRNFACGPGEDDFQDRLLAECAFLGPNEGNAESQVLEPDEDDIEDLFWGVRLTWRIHDSKDENHDDAHPRLERSRV